MDEELHVYLPQTPATPPMTARLRHGAATPGQGSRNTTPAGTADQAAVARRQLWAAESACYYAHRRYAQSGSDADRSAWHRRVQEREDAERALAQALGTTPPGPASA